ncbi:MAG: LysR family transcriptional regulator [Planctomycetes bacterium]|nr:LysR family transcriptional regulator [Planctomycetota bacterium]
MLNFDELRSYLVFTERMNFTHAARELHISQPALHVKIRKLSEGLRTPLYVRRGHSLVLTAEGRKVAGFAREIVERCGEVERELSIGQAAGPVVLAAGEGAYLYLLGPALKSFLRSARAPLRLLTLDGERSVEAVREGRAHVGVASLEANPVDLRTRNLARVGQNLAMPAAHPLARRKSLSLRDLRGCALVVPPPGRPQRAVLSRLLQSANVTWSIAVEATGWPLALEFVRIGLGLAVVNAFCAIPAGVVSRPITDMPAIQYQIFTRPQKSPDAPAERLADEILRRIDEAYRT